MIPPANKCFIASISSMVMGLICVFFEWYLLMVLFYSVAVILCYFIIHFLFEDLYKSEEEVKNV